MPLSKVEYYHFRKDWDQHFWGMFHFQVLINVVYYQ